MNKGARSFFLAILVIVGILFLLNMLGKGNGMSMLGLKADKLTYSEFTQELNSGNIQTADWQQAVISGEYQNGSKYTVRAYTPDSDNGRELMALLESKSVKIEMMGLPASQTIMPILGFLILPLLLFAVFYFVLIRPAQQRGSLAMPFGRSKVRVGMSEQQVKDLLGEPIGSFTVSTAGGEQTVMIYESSTDGSLVTVYLARGTVTRVETR